MTQLELAPRAPDGAEAAFRSWAETNAVIVRWLEVHAMALRSAGRERYSIKKLFEEARWDTALREQLGEFKLNNNWHSRAARLLMERRLELRGFFEVRKLKE